MFLVFDDLSCQCLINDNQYVSKVPFLGEGTQGPSGISQLPLPNSLQSQEFWIEVVHLHRRQGGPSLERGQDQTLFPFVVW